MDDDETAQLRQVMRTRYAVHYSALETPAQEPDNPADPAPTPVPKTPGHIDTDAGETW